MSGAISPLSQYAFMAWCLVKAQGQLYLYLKIPSKEIHQVSQKLIYSGYLIGYDYTAYSVTAKEEEEEEDKEELSFVTRLRTYGA
jgi:hypothetical protein